MVGRREDAIRKNELRLNGEVMASLPTLPRVDRPLLPPPPQSRNSQESLLRSTLCLSTHTSEKNSAKNTSSAEDSFERLTWRRDHEVRPHAELVAPQARGHAATVAMGPRLPLDCSILRIDSRSICRAETTKKQVIKFAQHTRAHADIMRPWPLGLLVTDAYSDHSRPQALLSTRTSSSRPGLLLSASRTLAFSPFLVRYFFQPLLVYVSLWSPHRHHLRSAATWETSRGSHWVASLLLLSSPLAGSLGPLVFLPTHDPYDRDACPRRMAHLHLPHNNSLVARSLWSSQG